MLDCSTLDMDRVSLEDRSVNTFISVMQLHTHQVSSASTKKEGEMRRKAEQELAWRM